MKVRSTFRTCLAMMLIVIVCANLTAVQADASDPSVIRDVKNRLSDISGKEKTIVEELFRLSSSIQQMDNEIVGINRRIDELHVAATGKETLIEAETLSYEKASSTLREVLRSRQRAGAASNLDIVLSAKSLKDLIHRINLLRDLSKNTSKLMDSIDAARAALEEEKRALNGLLLDTKKKQDQLSAAIAEKKQAKVKLEDYLGSLQSERGYYEGYLESVQKLWSTAKPQFAKAVASFRKIVETGALPEDTVQMTFSLFGVKGRIEESKFNRVLSTRRDLPAFSFDIHPGNVVLKFPREQLNLSGEFVLVNDHTVKYAVKEGAFYGLPLGEGALKDLFSDGDLVFSLKALTGNNRIKRLDTREGYLEMLVDITAN